VPLSTPVEPFKVRPEGKVPLVTDQVIGVLPAAARVVEYTTDTSAGGRGEADVIEGGASTVRLNASLVPPNVLVAPVRKVETPIAVGVPLINPVDPFKVSPVGSDPLVKLQVIGSVPEALSVCE
jgi:hypothetical protein